MTPIADRTGKTDKRDNEAWQMRDVTESLIMANARRRTLTLTEVFLYVGIYTLKVFIP